MQVRFPLILGLLPILLVLGWWLAQRRRLALLPTFLRGLAVSCLVLALANPVVPGTPAADPLVLLVDQSASIDPAVRSATWANAALAAERIAETRPVRLLAIGAYPALSRDGSIPPLDANGTDIAGALQLADGLVLNHGAALLISDGGATTPDTLATAQQLAQHQLPVYTVALTSVIDVRMEALRIPQALREGEQFSADMVITAPTPQSAQVEIFSDGMSIANETVNLQAGRTVFSIQSQAGNRGFHTFEATVTALGDPQAANNSASAWTIVEGPARVLIVERIPDSAAGLRDQLESAGLVTEAIRPNTLPTSLSELDNYDSIVLQDIPASSLGIDQQRAIQEFARSQGHGVVVLGGSNSFSLGEYAKTPLETMLPVSMEPPPRRERAAVALLLIIDRSASMLGRTGEDKFSLAKAAAVAATDSLGPDDIIGVLTFEATTTWTVDFTRVGTGDSLLRIQQQIRNIEAGGGTNIYAALDEGLPALALQDVAVRHAVLFTDGRSVSGDSYEALVTPLRNQGLTLSTIAIGDDADKLLLESLARLGAGRYHFAAEPADLPRLTLQETEIARLNPLSEGQFRLELKTPHPAIRGLNLATVPSLNGYIATTLKDDAEALLVSPEGDAVLSTWQYGLGRVVAWTSDANERWGADWRSWSGAGRFWAQLIAATYPDPQAGPLQISSTLDDEQAQLVLDAVDASGEPLDLADAVIRVIGPDGAEQVVTALQTAPGRYETTVSTTTQGVYQVLVALEHNGQRLEARSGIVQPYPAEIAVGADAALLSQIATISGGASAPNLDTALALIAPVTAGNPTQPLWPWLAGSALGIWIVEIAWRRGWLGTQKTRGSIE